MTVTLELSTEQEKRLLDSASRADADAVRTILLQALEDTVEHLLARPKQPSPERRRALLDQIAQDMAGTPVLSDEALSREAIYGDSG